MPVDPLLEQVIGGCRIEAVLGRGGMGVVYRAEQLRLGRKVALKLIGLELSEDEQFRRRFEQEARMAAAIDSPHVVTVYEAGDDDGRLFLVMRLVPGTDLRAVLASEGRLAPSRAIGIVAEVAEALDAAHARGLIHRDVKPANILLEPREGGERAYLSDFGLTKELTSTTGLTNTGEWVGTADYVAPEQIQGTSCDARTDVYALGCVLYQLLTGSVPFPRPSPPAKMWAHMNDQPPSLLLADTSLPAELDAVIACALAKRPEERFSSAGSLAAAAGAALQPHGVSSSAAVAPAVPDAQTVTHEQAAEWATWPLQRPVGTTAQAPAAPPAPPVDRRRTGGPLVIGAIALGLLVVGAAVAVLVTRSSTGSTPAAQTVPPPRTVVLTNPTSPTQVRTVTVPVSTVAHPSSPSSPSPPSPPSPSVSSSPVATLSTPSYSVSYPSKLMSPTSDRDSYKGRDSDGPRYNTEISSPDARWDLVVDRIPGDPHDAFSKASELTTKYITPANGFTILGGPTSTQVSGVPAAQFAYTTTKFPGFAVEDTFVIGNDSFAVRGRAPTLADARQLTDLAAGSLRPR